MIKYLVAALLFSTAAHALDVKPIHNADQSICISESELLDRANRVRQLIDPEAILMKDTDVKDLEFGVTTVKILKDIDDDKTEALDSSEITHFRVMLVNTPKGKQSAFFFGPKDQYCTMVTLDANETTQFMGELGAAIHEEKKS